MPEHHGRHALDLPGCLLARYWLSREFTGCVDVMDSKKKKKKERHR